MKNNQKKRYFINTIDINVDSSHTIILRQIKPNSAVLEFGPADGETTRYLKEELNCDVYIVEINKDAFDIAINYAVDGVLGDAAQKTWQTKFAKIKFDYVLFSDVLEHLYSPQEVLRRSLSLLKEGGEVLLSVPNIAHSAVILDLLQNKFEYKQVGLLDSTHIRFFTYYSLLEMLDEVGLVATGEYAIYAQPQHTEFRNNYDNFIEDTSVLKSKDFENVYQFIIKSVKKDYFYKHKHELNIAKEIVKNSSKPMHKGTIYYDTGTGFGEDNVFEFFYENENFTREILLPPNTLGIRYDPIEGVSCVVEGLTVTSDVGFLPVTTINSFAVGNYCIFLTIDPQLYIEIPQGVSSIFIKANIYPCPQKDLVGVFASVKGLINEHQEEITQNKNRIARKNNDLIQKNYELIQRNDELTKKNDEIIQKNNELARKNGEIIQKNNELIRSNEEINQRDTRISDLNSVLYDRDITILRKQYDLDIATMQHRAIQSSFWWRITKPARALTFVIKWILKNFPLTRAIIRHGHSRGQGQHVSLGLIEHQITPDERLAQENHRFSRDIKFSILVPLYNTSEKFLRELVESVRAQTYINWELCLADGSDSNHIYIRRICKELTKLDKRIKYRKLKNKCKISEIANECIKIATGDYYSMLNPADLLAPSALFEALNVICERNSDLIYTDENNVDAETKELYNPNHKPDYAPDYLRSMNYILRFIAVSREIVDKIGGLDPKLDGAHDYDFILRATEQASSICHIPKVLYHKRSHETPAGPDFDILEAGRKALEAHLSRSGLKGKVLNSEIPNTYRIIYEIKNEPPVSIIIPNKDHIDDLGRCLASIESLSTYRNYEIIVVENNSEKQETFDYYEDIVNNERISVVYYQGEFNYPKINNYGTLQANGDYFIFLNNDTEIITPDWIQELLMYAQREDVGAVGAKLYYPDLKIQHAGVVVGNGYIGIHTFYHGLYSRDDLGYGNRLATVQNYTATTGACIMVRKDNFVKIGGFFEDLAVAYNDLYLCLELRNQGLLIVWTPFCELYHHESKTRGYDDTPEKVLKCLRERTVFEHKWSHYWKNGDPYYNINFCKDNANFVFH